MSRLDKIRTLLADTPNDVFLNYTYAMELAKGGDLTQIREAFRKTLELDPNYVPAHFQFGQALAARGEIDDARRVLENGVEVARRVGDSHALGEMTEFLESL
ncbi:tetratricopeptide repeat protein [Planctomicrobium sp. SH664]|uniref:tetratricopeptide repeat protein n=1 Tax=Planctomicrobium sp. SH664 TaxID=3448125 RepID=UPI003F5B044E